MQAIILAGGVGTRLWPCSRQSRPKQFTDITGSGRSLLQSTVDRLEGLVTAHEIYVITNEGYTGLAAEQVAWIPPGNIIAEPCGRNTAPAIGLACIHLRRHHADGVMAVLPADHTIQNTPQFQTALRQAERLAEAGYLVMLGIEPYVPHTGYGYIKRGTTLFEDRGLSAYRVERFYEKPDLPTAQRFVAGGGFYWNGGIFVCRVDRMLEEIARQLPELHTRLAQIAASLDDPATAVRVMAELWPHMPNISIDYGVIEGARQVAVIPLHAGWNDVGSWDALEQILAAAETPNVHIRGDVLPLESSGNVIYGNGRFLALVGVNDLVIVDTHDAILIGHKSQMQKVKSVVEHLRQTNRDELL